jgi:hypothetical protein
MVALTLVSCGGASVPENFTQSESLPKIYPDYVDVTIPVNIAPLTFMMEQPVDEMVARLSFGNEEMVLGGEKILPDVDDWHELLQQAKGQDITVEVYARQGEQWGLQRLEANSVLSPFGVYARPDAQDAFLPFDVEFSGIADVERQAAANDAHPTFNLMGQKVLRKEMSVDQLPQGVYIINGKKIIKR